MSESNSPPNAYTLLLEDVAQHPDSRASLAKVRPALDLAARVAIHGVLAGEPLSVVADRLCWIEGQVDTHLQSIFGQLVDPVFTGSNGGR